MEFEFNVYDYTTKEIPREQCDVTVKHFHGSPYAIEGTLSLLSQINNWYDLRTAARVAAMHNASSLLKSAV